MSVPSLFRKRYTEKALQKKILARIPIARDRDYLEGLFLRGEDGRYGIDPGMRPSKAERKRLKSLAKAVKANRGVIKAPKLAAALVLLAAVAGGYFLFRNLVARKALEAGLEAVFQARARVEGMDFDLFGARVAWTRLEVADRDRPMKNLFELGPTRAELNGQALLRLRFVVETIESRDIRWNTDRKTSGALPGAPKPEKEGPGLLDKAGASVMGALSSVDVEALIQEEYEKLASPRAAEKARAEMEARKDALERKSAALKEKIRAASGPAGELGAVDIGSIKTPEAVASALAKANAALPAVRELAASAEDLRREIDGAVREAAEAKKALEKALDDDYARVEALTGLSGGDSVSLARGLFAGYASESLGVWYGYGRRALEAARNLTREKGGTAKPAPRTAFQGRDIPFPVRDALPRFWIKNFAFSTASAPLVTGRAEDITGEPDLVGKPARFTASYENREIRLGLEGLLDLRKEATVEADLGLKTAGFPVRAAPPSPVLTIASLEGPLELEARMRLLPGGAMDGRLEGALLRPRVTRQGKGDRVSDLAYGVLSGARRVDITARFSAGPGRGMDLSLSSSLDAALKEGLSAYIKDEEKKLKARAKAALQDRLNEALAENETLRAGIEEARKIAGGDMTEAGALSSGVEGKKKEIEKRGEELKKQAADSLLEKLPGKVPGKLPAVPKF